MWSGTASCAPTLGAFGAVQELLEECHAWESVADDAGIGG